MRAAAKDAHYRSVRALPPTRTLSAILLNPPTGSGALTRGRLDLAARVLGVERVAVANLFPLPTKCSKGIVEVGAERCVWIDAREAIADVIHSAHGVLLAWGTSLLTGAAREHQIAQIEWVRDALLASRHDAVWMVAVSRVTSLDGTAMSATSTCGRMAARSRIGFVKS